MSIESVMPSNNLTLRCLCLLLLSNFPSIGVFSNGSALHIRWPKYWSSASALVFLMNSQGWFSLGLTGSDLLAVQGTLKSLIQLHSLKASILWPSAFLWSNRIWLLEKPCVRVCLCAQSYLIPCNPVDRNPPGSSVHGIFQARILVWAATSSSGGSDSGI